MSQRHRQEAVPPPKMDTRAHAHNERHRINSELGRGDLSPYDMRAVALTLPALESIGYELGPYHGPRDTVAMAGIIRRSAEVELATLTGEN